MNHEKHICVLHGMLRGRRLEAGLAQEYTRGNIGGFLHLCPGERAVAAAGADHLRRLTLSWDHRVVPGAGAARFHRAG